MLLFMHQTVVSICMYLNFCWFVIPPLCLKASNLLDLATSKCFNCSFSYNFESIISFTLEKRSNLSFRPFITSFH